MKMKQEQIEEMARCMGEKNFLCADDCENCIQIPCKCKLVKQSKLLYKAGYRKASDVIDEFVKKLKAKESPKLLTWEYAEGYSDCIKIVEQIAAEMQQEVES